MVKTDLVEIVARTLYNQNPLAGTNGQGDPVYLDYSIAGTRAKICRKHAEAVVDRIWPILVRMNNDRGSSKDPLCGVR